MNPNGKVPTLALEDGTFLPESNAILYYLAEGSRAAALRPPRRARVLQWMFFEQYSHEPYVAVARFILFYQPPDSPRRAELPRLHERGNQALGVMEQHLAASRSSPPASTASPTSRSSRTRTAPPTAASTSRPTPPSTPGSTGCARNRASSLCLHEG